MKMSHLYFDKYCTRDVTFENTSGLFHLNGEPVSREQLEAPIVRNHKTGHSSPQNFGASTVSVSELTAHPPRMTNKSLSGNHAPVSETVSKNKTKRLHPEEISEIRAKEMARLKHIYHDDNFVRINRENKEHLVTSKRTWLGSQNLHNHTVACMTSVVTTEVPQNRKQLNLTALRQYGGGQDKPHHVMPANDSRRMNI